MWLLDTNVVSELMRPVPDAGVLAWVNARPIDELRLSAISVAELWTGVYLLPHGARRKQVVDSVGTLMEAFWGRITAFDHADAGSTAEVIARRRRSGRPISWQDAQIAGIARQRNHILVTRNTRDFEECGVSLVNPWGQS